MDFDSTAMVAGLSRWIATESPTHDKNGVNRMIDLVAEGLAGLPIGIERIAGRDGLADTLIAKAGPQTAAPGILVLSHLDTVHPLGTLANGLPLRREDDRLYGPGIYDMKGGAYLALEAFRAVARQASAGLPITYLFTPDEEIGSPTTRGLIEAEGRRAAYVLVTEPARAGGKVVTSRKGVGRFDVRVDGRPSHAGSRHEAGRSAIREAAHQILKIEAMTDYGRGVTTTVGLVTGGTAENVVPQHATFSVDLRVIDAEQGEAECAAILALKPVTPDVTVAITGGMNRPPYVKTPANARLFEFAKARAAELGMALEDAPMVGGGSDGNFTAVLGVPTLDGLGIEGDGAHTLQEYGLVSSLAPRARLMERLLATLR